MPIASAGEAVAATAGTAFSERAPAGPNHLRLLLGMAPKTVVRCAANELDAETQSTDAFVTPC